MTGKEVTFNSIAKKIIKLSNSNIRLTSLKRNQPMPHNGYRVFDNSKIYKFFPNFKFTKFDKSLNDYLSNFKSLT